MLFCDTSTLAKVYLPEKESASVRAVLENEDQVFVSELAKTEMMAVFHRQLREKKWSRELFQAALRQFTNDDIGGFWTWLPLDSEIVDGAARTFTMLPETVFLRSSDCLHLVTALQNGFSEIHTHDAHQIRAAVALGVKPLTL